VKLLDQSFLRHIDRRDDEEMRKAALLDPIEALRYE
jgi:hypothetical protein